MNSPQCGSGDEQHVEKEPDLSAEEPQVSGDKGRASPQGASNQSDSSVTQNEAGISSGRGTLGCGAHRPKGSALHSASEAVNDAALPRSWIKLEVLMKRQSKSVACRYATNVETVSSSCQYQTQQTA